MSSSLRPALVLAVLSAIAIGSPLAAQAAPQFTVVKRIAVGGEGGWDYLTVDPLHHRLFVSHSTLVNVIDLDRDTVVGEIPNTPGVHGIAIAGDEGHGFTSNGRDSSVTMFDLTTLETLGRTNVRARNPDAIVYDAVSHRVFTMNGGSATATAIDAATGAVVDTIPLGGRPEFAVADGQGRIYANLEDKSEIVVFDSRSLAVMAHWSLAPCEEPSGLAMDRANRRLFSVCGNQLMAVMNADSGGVIATFPIGNGVDGAAFDPATGLAFSSNGEGTVTMVHEDGPDRFSAAGTIQTARGARTIALDERTHRLFLSTAEFGPAPAPTADRPRPRPPVVPGSFTVLVLGQ